MPRASVCPAALSCRGLPFSESPIVARLAADRCSRGALDGAVPDSHPDGSRIPRWSPYLHRSPLDRWRDFNLLTHALPSTYYEPLRIPTAPGLSLAGVRLVIPDHVVGPPVLRTLSLCTCCRHYPGAAAGRIASLVTQPCQPSPKARSGRPAHRPFRGLLGVHLRCSPHTRAVTVFRDTHSEGFSYFVTSIAAPVASGWSGRRVGLAPTGKRRLVTAHRQTGRSSDRSKRHDYRIGAGISPRASHRAGRAAA